MQANSLLKQHKNFCGLQNELPFVLDYMDLLGHHEFGLHQRAFDSGFERNPHCPDNLEYWIEEWYRTYSTWFSLKAKYPGRVLAADFSNSERSSEALKKFLSTNLGLPKQNVLIDWKHSPPPAQTKVDLSNLEKALDLFDRLNLIDP